MTGSPGISIKMPLSFPKRKEKHLKTVSHCHSWLTSSLVDLKSPWGGGGIGCWEDSIFSQLRKAGFFFCLYVCVCLCVYIIESWFLIEVFMTCSGHGPAGVEKGS